MNTWSERQAPAEIERVRRGMSDGENQRPYSGGCLQRSPDKPVWEGNRTAIVCAASLSTNPAERKHRIRNGSKSNLRETTADSRDNALGLVPRERFPGRDSAHDRNDY